MCLALKRKSLILSASFMALVAGKNWKKPAPPILPKKLAILQLLSANLLDILDLLFQKMYNEYK